MLGISLSTNFPFSPKSICTKWEKRKPQFTQCSWIQYGGVKLHKSEKKKQKQHKQQRNKYEKKLKGWEQTTMDGLLASCDPKTDIM